MQYSRKTWQPSTQYLYQQRNHTVSRSKTEKKTFYIGWPPPNNVKYGHLLSRVVMRVQPFYIWKRERAAFQSTCTRCNYVTLVSTAVITRRIQQVSKELNNYSSVEKTTLSGGSRHGRTGILDPPLTTHTASVA